MGLRSRPTASEAGEVGTAFVTIDGWLMGCVSRTLEEARCLL